VRSGCGAIDEVMFVRDDDAPPGTRTVVVRFQVATPVGAALMLNGSTLQGSRISVCAQALFDVLLFVPAAARVNSWYVCMHTSLGHLGTPTLVQVDSKWSC
jgi:hypothetical protein